MPNVCWLQKSYLKHKDKSRLKIKKLERISFQKTQHRQTVVVHAINPYTWEAETGESL